MRVAFLSDVRGAYLACRRSVAHQLRDEHWANPCSVEPRGAGVTTLVGRDSLAHLLAGRLAVLVLGFPDVVNALLQSLERQHAAVPASWLPAGAKQRR